MSALQLISFFLLERRVPDAVCLLLCVIGRDGNVDFVRYNVNSNQMIPTLCVTDCRIDGVLFCGFIKIVSVVSMML